MPWTRLTGPVRMASPMIVGSRARTSYSSSSSGNVRSSTPRPHGTPAGATNTRLRTRSGCSSASSVATSPPSEWARMSTRPSPMASSRRPSHGAISPARRRPSLGSSTRQSRLRSASLPTSGSHQRHEPDNPCNTTRSSPSPTTRQHTGLPSTATRLNSIRPVCSNGWSSVRSFRSLISPIRSLYAPSKKFCKLGKRVAS